MQFTQNTQNADALSSILSQAESWRAIRDSCGGNPTAIGTCKFDSESQSPLPSSLNLFGHHELAFSYVLYDSHSPQSLRFYVIELPVDSSSGSPSSNPYKRLAEHDFTRQRCRAIDQAIDDVVINQVSCSTIVVKSLFIKKQINAASLIQTVIRAPSSSPKLLPVTASVLLTLASHLGSLSVALLSVSRLVTRLTNAPVNPFATAGSFPTYTRLKDVSTIGLHLPTTVRPLLIDLASTTS